MSSPDAVHSDQITTERKLNWKRGGIALVLAILVVGLGHLYERRWQLAIAYELAIPFLCVVARQTVLRGVIAGLATLVCAALLQLFVVGQALWFGLRSPRGRAMPNLSRAVWVFALGMAAVSALISYSGFFQKDLIGLRGFKMDSGSMAPTLRAGDRIVVDMNAYRQSPPRRGDVVIFEKDPHTTWTKRIVAIEGDTLGFRETGIVLDGKPLSEPYLAPPDPNANPQRIFPEHTVASGDVFVLGDDRDNSYDSRYFGDVPDKAVIGKVIGIYWSPDHSRIGRAVR